jgi:branched-chain amino acid transport system ATP-binding protein
MLSVEGVSTYYGPIQALHDISIKVDEGEVVTMLGGNGAGKSTTLRTVSGLLSPRRGTIRFESQVISGRSPGRIARSGMVQVPEGRQIIPGLGVLDNLRLGVSNRRLKRSEIGAALDEVFDFFPRLRHLQDRLGWMLSGGEQQMLAIGRGMMARPRVLLLDEPSLGLAPIIVQQVFAVIRRLREAGTTILLVEQNAFQALQVADRGYVLESGRVVLEGPADSLLDSDRLKAAYLGKGKGGAGMSSVEQALVATDGQES